MRISDWSSDVCSSDLSYALSTNVLHYQALQLVKTMADAHHDAKAAAGYRAQATALKAAINAHSWRAEDGKSVVSGKSGSGRVHRGGRRIVLNKQHDDYRIHTDFYEYRLS